jgi:hypothetical protein
VTKNISFSECVGAVDPKISFSECVGAARSGPILCKLSGNPWFQMHQNLNTFVSVKNEHFLKRMYTK